MSESQASVLWGWFWVFFVLVFGFVFSGVGLFVLKKEHFIQFLFNNFHIF